MAGLLEVVDYLLKRLFGSTKLHAYERHALDAWRSRLSPVAVAILDRQLGRYDFVQRQSAGKATYLFCLRDPSCAKWPSDALFPLRTEDARALARIKLTAGGGQSRPSLAAAVMVGQGRFLGIEFDRRPDRVFPKGVKAEEIEVTDVKLLADPMSPDPYATAPLTDTGQLRGWLREWAESWELREARQPLPPASGEKLIGQVEAKLPADYLVLVAQVEGLQAGHCRIHGLSQIWNFVWPDESFYILADIEGRGAVGVRRGDEDGVLYYLDNEDDEAQAVGTSLRAVIERELELARGGEGPPA